MSASKERETLNYRALLLRHHEWELIQRSIHLSLLFYLLNFLVLMIENNGLIVSTKGGTTVLSMSRSKIQYTQ
jgi:hypothetical protein